MTPLSPLHVVAALCATFWFPTFFFPDEAALSARFKAHNLPVPDFRNGPGKTRTALVKDPDDQWVELVVTPGAAAKCVGQASVRTMCFGLSPWTTPRNTLMTSAVLDSFRVSQNLAATRKKKCQLMNGT